MQPRPRTFVALVTAAMALSGCSYDDAVTWAESEDAPAADSLTARTSARPPPAATPVTESRTESTEEGAHATGAPADGAAPAVPDAAEPSPSEPPGEEPSGEPDDVALHGIVGAHNAVRSSVVPTPNEALGALSWSDAAAAVARSWASGCTFAHNPNRGNLGENIYAASAGYGSTPASVVQNWASESSNYDYASNSCSGVCGHYTQVVWRATSAVGCAVQQCTGGGPFGGGSWELWVCDYAPPGNYTGQRPY